MSTHNNTVVIVGGGMVGISLALLLSKALPNLAVTLIEQHAFPSAKSLSESSPPLFQASFDDRSTALSAGSVAILQQMDCWSLLKAHVQTIQTIHVSDRGHLGGALLEAADYGVDALGYVLENKFLGQVLLQQLQQTKVTLLAPATVKHCLANKGGYALSVTVDKQVQQLQAGLLIIADGASSNLRQALGISCREKNYHQSALIANVALEHAHGGVAYERFTDEGPMALLPLSTLDGLHRAALVWTMPQSRVDTFLRLDNPHDRVTLLQQRFGYRAGKFMSMGEHSLYPLTLVEADEQLRSHVVLIGNAAHFLHPAAGQGFNLSLRDCQVLVDCLKAAPSAHPFGSYAAIKPYVDKRMRDQQLTIGLTDRLVTLFSNNQLPLAVLRQLGLLSLQLLPAAKQRFTEQMMGVGV
jgi:2-polyprenyl-6-methoxyphenol 4-hydroxylase